MEVKRIESLDALRGVAALLVVFYHYFNRYPNLYPSELNQIDFLYYGSFGVQLFFIISGFVIFLSIRKNDAPGQFIIARFTRLYPTFSISVLTTSLFLLFLYLPDRSPDIETSILNLLMVHQYLNISHVDGVYWTLTIELTFYFWVLIFLLAKKADKIPLFLFLLTSISILLSYLNVEIPTRVRYFFLLDYSSFFLLGAALYLLKTSDNKTENLFLSIFAVIACLVDKSVQAQVANIAIIVIFYSAISFDFLNQKYGILSWFGMISYPLYLLHQNISYSIIYNSTEILDINLYIAIILAFCCSVFLSKILHNSIEKDFSHKLKNYLKNHIA